jgi:hypothetical protein
LLISRYPDWNWTIGAGKVRGTSYISLSSVGAKYRSPPSWHPPATGTPVGACGRYHVSTAYTLMVVVALGVVVPVVCTTGTYLIRTPPRLKAGCGGIRILEYLTIELPPSFPRLPIWPTIYPNLIFAKEASTSPRSSLHIVDCLVYSKFPVASPATTTSLT